MFLWHLGTAATGISEVVSYKFLGKDATDRLVKLINDLRAGPPPLRETRSETAIVSAGAKEAIRVVNGADSPELQAQVELAVSNTIPSLPLEELRNNEIPVEQAAAALLKSIPKKLPNRGFYLLWLGKPFLQWDAGFCHFYWIWQEKYQKTAFTIRDFRNGTIYFGRRTTETKDPEWATSVILPETVSALDVWHHHAKRRIRCRGVFLYEVNEHFNDWKATLDEMTQACANGVS
jgi:hypothetical protein